MQRAALRIVSVHVKLLLLLLITANCFADGLRWVWVVKGAERLRAQQGYADKAQIPSRVRVDAGGSVRLDMVTAVTFEKDGEKDVLTLLGHSAELGKVSGNVQVAQVKAHFGLAKPHPEKPRGH